MSTATPSSTIIGPALPNIPWEERPSNHGDVLWRSARNPIIPHDLIPSSNSIFNSAVVPFGGGFAGVFRCDNKARTMQLHSGRSADGVTWELQQRTHRNGSRKTAVWPKSAPSSMPMTRA